MSISWSIVTLAGLWGFVLATIGLILKGFPGRGVFDRRCALCWGAALLCCFIVWLVGMANA